MGGEVVHRRDTDRKPHSCDIRYSLPVNPPVSGSQSLRPEPLSHPGSLLFLQMFWCKTHLYLRPPGRDPEPDPKELLLDSQVPSFLRDRKTGRDRLGRKNDGSCPLITGSYQGPSGQSFGKRRRQRSRTVISATVDYCRHRTRLKRRSVTQDYPHLHIHTHPRHVGPDKPTLEGLRSRKSLVPSMGTTPTRV